MDYTGGRSNGCTSWSPSDAGQIIPMLKDKPTTLYIYPESEDIDAVARAVAAGQSPSRAGLYWNASCLKRNPRADPRSIQGGSSAAAAAAGADLQAAVKFASCYLSRVRLFLVSLMGKADIPNPLSNVR